MRILSASCFSKFFGGKIKNFEQGFGEQKMKKKRSDLMSRRGTRNSALE